MKEYWDQRYSEEGFAYGREPNQFFRETLDTLKPGGTLILECFHKEQLKFGTGGPKVPEMLYNKEILMKDFNSLEISLCNEDKVDIFEGEYHSGTSSVVRLVAQKPR